MANCTPEHIMFLRDNKAMLTAADIIIVAGASHAGKTTLAKLIQDIFAKVMIPEGIVAYPINEAIKIPSREDWYNAPKRKERYKKMIAALRETGNIGCVSEGWVAPKELIMLRQSFNVVAIGIKVTYEELVERMKERGDKTPEAYVKPSFEYITKVWDEFKFDLVFNTSPNKVEKLSSDLREDVDKFAKIWNAKPDKKIDPNKTPEEVEPFNPSKSSEPEKPKAVTEADNKERKAKGLPMLCPKCGKEMTKHYHSPKTGKEVICLACSGRTEQQYEEDKTKSNPKFQTPGKDHADWPKDLAWPGKPEVESGKEENMPEKDKKEEIKKEEPKKDEMKKPEDKTTTTLPGKTETKPEEEKPKLSDFKTEEKQPQEGAYKSEVKGEFDMLKKEVNKSDDKFVPPWRKGKK